MFILCFQFNNLMYSIICIDYVLETLIEDMQSYILGNLKYLISISSEC